MNSTNFQLILTEPSGNYAIPDVVITSEFETTFSIQSAADISQRKDNLTKSITFPGTKNNNRIFNNLYSLNRNSNSNISETLFANYSPNIGVRATLYESNVPIMTGDLKINDISKDKNGAYTYTGVITGNRVSFFSKIKDVYLKDLPAFDRSVVYTKDGIVFSWTYADTDLFLYPQIDFGKGVAQNRATFDLRNFRPAVYVRQYIKEILASQGYKYVSQFIDSEYFKRAFIPFTAAEFGSTIYGDVATGSGAGAIYHLQRNGDQADGAGLQLGTLSGTPLITRTTNVQIGGKSETSVDDTFDFFPDLFTFNKFCTTGAQFTFNYDIGTSAGNAAARIKLSQVINGQVGKGSYIDASEVFSFSNAGHRTGTITLKLPYGTYEKGFTFAVWAETYIAGDETTDVTFSNITASFGNPDAAVGSSFGLEFGDSYNLKDAIPQDQKAAEFLRSILQFFNMYMIENPENERELLIEPYDTFYSRAITPALNAADWSRKVDQDKLHIKINTALPKTYNFKFKEDGDYYNTLYKNTWGGTYGDFSIDNRIGTADPKNIEVIFSPTVVVKESVDDKTFPAIYDGDPFNKKSIKSNLRILFNNGITSCQSYDLVLSYPGDPVRRDTVFAGLTYYQRSHHVLTLTGTDVFNLLFGLPRAVYYQVSGNVFSLPTIYSSLYENQIAELNSENIFTLEVDAILRESDISRLDLRTPIFLSTVQGAAYFKIMSVTYYNRDEKSKVVLQKVIL